MSFGAGYCLKTYQVKQAFEIQPHNTESLDSLILRHKYLTDSISKELSVLDSLMSVSKTVVIRENFIVIKDLDSLVNSLNRTLNEYKNNN